MFLYAFECGSFHKIGVSLNPVARLESIQAANPIEVKFVASWRMPRRQAYIIEGELHRLLHPFRGRGEWFEVSLATMAGVLKMMSPIIFATGVRLPDPNVAFENAQIDFVDERALRSGFGVSEAYWASALVPNADIPRGGDRG